MNTQVSTMFILFMFLLLLLFLTNHGINLKRLMCEYI